MSNPTTPAGSKTINPSEMTIGDLLKVMRPGTLWACLGAMAVMLGGAFALGKLLCSEKVVTVSLPPAHLLVKTMAGHKDGDHGYRLLVTVNRSVYALPALEHQFFSSDWSGGISAPLVVPWSSKYTIKVKVFTYDKNGAIKDVHTPSEDWVVEDASLPREKTLDSGTARVSLALSSERS